AGYSSEGKLTITFLDLIVVVKQTAPSTLMESVGKVAVLRARFKVMCLDTWGEGAYLVKIFPSSYWEPLRVSASRALVVMHPQIEPSNIVYRITEGPYHGWLEVTTTPGTLEVENYNEEPLHIVVFDQSIINENRLVYVQSGVNRTRDRIRMDVTNGIVWLKDVEIAIIIIPEHFYVSARNLTVVEGASVSLRPDSFRTETEYYRGKVVSYKVAKKPKFGKIVMGDQELDGLPLVALTESGKQSCAFALHVNIVPVNDETPIVAANTGLCVRHCVRSHDDEGRPADRHGTKGKMIFNVTDGLHELSKITFLISTKSVSLKIVRKQNLRVFPLMREPLNNYILMSKCSDPTRNIIYRVERAPTLGRLIMMNGENHHRSIKQFTQQDVNNTIVYYEHTHPFSDLHTNDSFVFTVEAALAKPLNDLTFNIDISVSSGGLAKYVHIPEIKVQEGDKVAIKANVTNVIAYLETQAGVRQPQIEAQWSQPLHGELKPFMSSLTQSQLEGGVVNYEHDDSDTLQDKIEMALFLLPDYVLLCNVTIPIHVIPVNDQPFRLLTDTPQIQVVQGENYTITKSDLLTEDVDTGPAGILYDIISGPTQGRMVMLDKNQTIDQAQSINKFTQDDINNGRVIYEHSGMLQTATFYFRVWDGQFKPTYTVFTIDVVPVILNVTSSHPINLQQGSNVATVTTDQIYIDTNAQKIKVWYNITRQPNYGMIYVGRNPVTYFSHKDLMDKVVIYMQNDMTTANDGFDLIAYVHHSNGTRPFTIEVTVQPLMTLGDFKVETDKAKITLANMDATGLAKLTASDPIYTLLRKPRFGTLKKIIRSSGEKTSAREREVAYFTHEDVKAGVIYYVARKKISDLNGLEDSFRFLLTATIFQPAAGECRRYIMREQNALVKIHGQAQGVAPIPLPRPPDHLMPKNLANMSLLRSPTNVGGSAPELTTTDNKVNQMTLRKHKGSPHTGSHGDCGLNMADLRNDIMGLLKDFTISQNEHMTSMRQDISQIKNQMDNIQSTTEYLVTEQSKIRTEMNELKNQKVISEEKFKILENDINALKTGSGQEPSSSLPTSSREDLIREIGERSNREKNILIIGVTELHGSEVETPAQQLHMKELKQKLLERHENGETELTIKYIKGYPKIVSSSKN
ncbi:putative Chondroitin sulfate proteoglycan 4, partial [Operophtera brumata]